MSDRGTTALADLAAEPDEGPPEQLPARSRGRRVLLVLLAVLVLVVGAVAAYVAYLGYTVNSNVTHEALLPQDRPAVQAPDGSPVPEAGVGTNFLVVGADARPGDPGRADVIVLVHVPEDPTSIHMIHFPRDLYVDIPGRGKDKINAAYAYGGAPLLVQTVEDLLKVPVDHVATTDFEGFRRMTDAVGGVRVYAEEASSTGSTVIRKGWNDLDGQQALAFVRERHALSEGDISRGRRQLAFIKALLLEATSRDTVTNPLKVARLADAATRNLVVDDGLTMSAMRDYALALRGIRAGDVVFATAPFSGFATTAEGASIDVVDEDGMAELGEALRTDSMDDYLDVFVTP